MPLALYSSLPPSLHSCPSGPFRVLCPRTNSLSLSSSLFVSHYDCLLATACLRVLSSVRTHCFIHMKGCRMNDTQKAHFSPPLPLPPPFLLSLSRKENPTTHTIQNAGSSGHKTSLLQNNPFSLPPSLPPSILPSLPPPYAATLSSSGPSSSSPSSSSVSTLIASPNLLPGKITISPYAFLCSNCTKSQVFN